MSGNHLNIHSKISYQLKTKLFWLIAIALLALIAIPSGIVFANEANAGSNDNPNADISLLGTVSVYEPFDKKKDPPEVHVIGWDENGNFFETKPVYVHDDGTYTITNIPSTVNGLIVAKYYQAETGFKVLPHETKTGVDFNLARGARGPFGDSEFLNHYIIKAGSTFTDADGVTLSLDKDLNLPEGFLPNIGFTDGSLLVPDHKLGTLTYKFESEMGHMSMIITCKGKNNKEFTNFIINHRVRMFEYKVHSSNTLVPVDPVFTEAGTMIISGNLRDAPDESEEILKHDPYVYAVWFNVWTGEIGHEMGVVAPPFSNEGNYGFTSIPSSAIGVVAAGASGHAMDFGMFYYSGDPSTQRVDLSVPEGAKFTVQTNEGLNKVLLAAGTKFTYLGEEIVLPEDIDFGNVYPPFGLPLSTNLTFNPDGTVSYVYNASEEHHEITHAEFIFKVVPQTGYVFNKWLLNGVETSGNYTVTSKDDVYIEPVITVPTPAPEPENVNGNSAQTGDNLNAIIPVLFVLASLGTITLISRKKYKA